MFSPAMKHPDQMELEEAWSKPLSNAERQRRFREAQRKIGRKQVGLYMTDDERHVVERVLKAMREQNLMPAMGRDDKGQMKDLDI